MAARTWPHRTLRTAPRQTRRSPLNPATRSAADRTGVRAPTPIRCVQSRCPLASPAACASPLPCAHCRNTRLWIAQFISYRYPDLHHRLLDTIHDYMVCHSEEIGDRILSSYPALHGAEGAPPPLLSRMGRVPNGGRSWVPGFPPTGG